MKHIFLFLLMVWATLGVCNCTVEPNQNNAPTKPETQEAEGTEGIPPVIIPPEIIPPEVIPPVVEPPEVIPPEVVTPEDETQEVEDEESETQEIVRPVINLLQINELRTEFSIPTKRMEYIEFKTKAAGNLNGFQLYIMYETNNPFIYTFPAVDVASGEYITLHLRTLESNCVDELGKNLSLSGGTDSCATARDLWVSGSNKLLHQTSIVYLQDANGKIIDAIIMNEALGNTWNKNQAHFAEIAERLFKEGMWKSANGSKPTSSDAVNTSAIKGSVYKSVSRYEGRENTHSAKDWYIAGYITPGLPNK